MASISRACDSRLLLRSIMPALFDCFRLLSAPSGSAERVAMDICGKKKQAREFGGDSRGSSRYGDAKTRQPAREAEQCHDQTAFQRVAGAGCTAFTQG